MADSIRRCAVPTAAACLLIVGGCGSSPVQPYQDLARAEAGINQAEQSGARQYGAMELDNAKEKLNKARAAVERDEMQAAERYAEEAALAADLAAAKTRTYKAELSVKKLEDSIAVLREEIARNQRREGDTE